VVWGIHRKIYKTGTKKQEEPSLSKTVVPQSRPPTCGFSSLKKIPIFGVPRFKKNTFFFKPVFFFPDFPRGQFGGWISKKPGFFFFNLWMGQRGGPFFKPPDLPSPQVFFFPASRLPNRGFFFGPSSFSWPLARAKASVGAGAKQENFPKPQSPLVFSQFFPPPSAGLLFCLCFFPAPETIPLETLPKKQRAKLFSKLKKALVPPKKKAVAKKRNEKLGVFPRRRFNKSPSPRRPEASTSSYWPHKPA